MERLTFAVTGGRIEGKTLSGVAHVYGSVTVDGRKHSFAPGAFAKSIAEGSVMAYWGHETPLRLASQRAGTLRLSDGPTALQVAMDLPDTTYAQDIKALIAAGEEVGMSFEVYPNKPPLKSKGVSIFSDVRLAKINLVDFPAFEGTSVVLNSAQELETSRAQLLRIRARLHANDRGIPSTSGN